MLQSLKNKIKGDAIRILMKNAKHGITKDGREYFYVCSSLERYQHQWLWDSCFNSIAMSCFEPRLAEKEMETLLSMVQVDGFLPHIIFWDGQTFPGSLVTKYVYGNKEFTRLTQPPIVGLAIEKIYSRTKNKKFLEKTLPKAKKFYLWLMKERDLDGDSLISIIHPYESGTDHNPEFDFVYGLKKPNFFNITSAVIKTLFDCRRLDWSLEKIAKEGYFNIESAAFNSLYALSLNSMSKLFEELGNDKDARFFKKESIKTEKAIIKKCYDSANGVFVDLAFNEEVKLPAASFFSIFPIILKNIDADIVDDIVKKHLMNPEEFWLPYPIPSVPKNNPSFSPGLTMLLWRGPTWININWLIFNTLKEKGYENIARHIRDRTVELVLKSGFREFYNPITGQGLRSKDFAWSTLVVDMLEE